MKKLNLLVTTILLFTFLLTACVPASEFEATPEFTEPSAGLPGTPDDLLPEEPLTTEPGVTPEDTTLPTETAVLEATESPVITEEMQPTEALSSTVIIPDTGAIDPGRVSNLLDFDVWNRNNEILGSVEDLIFNIDNREIDYVLIEVGGFLGVGGKLVAVPYDYLEVVTSASDTVTDTFASDGPQNAFILDATNEELESALDFDPAVLPGPDEPAENYDADFGAYWETGVMTETETMETPQATEEMGTDATPEATESSEMMGAEWQGVILATDVIGLAVQDGAGNDLATVEDIFVDAESGEIQYVALEVFGMDGHEGEWLLLPVDILSHNAPDNILIVSVDQNVLNGAIFYDPANLPKTTDPDWDADIQPYWEDYRM